MVIPLIARAAAKIAKSLLTGKKKSSVSDKAKEKLKGKKKDPLSEKEKAVRKKKREEAKAEVMRQRAIEEANRPEQKARVSKAIKAQKRHRKTQKYQQERLDYIKKEGRNPPEDSLAYADRVLKRIALDKKNKALGRKNLRQDAKDRRN